MTFELRIQGCMRASCVTTWTKGNKEQCKGLGVRTYQVCSRNSKEASAAGAEKRKGSIVVGDVMKTHGGLSVSELLRLAFILS